MRNFLFFSLFLLIGFNVYPINAMATEQKHPIEWSFQAPASEIMHDINGLHNFMSLIMGTVFILVCLALGYIIWRFSAKRNPIASKFSHNTLLEIVWTLIPLAIVGVIAISSFKVLHKLEIQPKAEMILKVVGHQWYWTYEYPEHAIRFDSYMKKDDELLPDDKRLLSVDNYVVVPVNTNIRVVVTADDVIHAWAIPALGVKKDAVPGRLNEIWFNANREGIFYGQCSELCGILHGFMPIEVRVVSKEDFVKWTEENKVKFSI